MKKNILLLSLCTFTSLSTVFSSHYTDHDAQRMLIIPMELTPFPLIDIQTTTETFGGFKITLSFRDRNTANKVIESSRNIYCNKEYLWKNLSRLKPRSDVPISETNSSQTYSILNNSFEIVRTPQFITIKSKTDAEKNFSFPMINISDVDLFQTNEPINLFLSIDQSKEEFENQIASLLT